MRIAITGGAGHIGNCLIRELRNGNHEIKALSRTPASYLNNLNITFVHGNLNDTQSINELCSDVDAVVHLAAKIAIDKKDTDKVYKTNVEGTKNLMDACIENGVKKLIHFSSIHALDPHPLNEKLDESRDFVGNTKLIYEQTKAESEKLVLQAAKNGLDATILSPTAVVGPYDFKDSYLGQALIKIYQNNLPMLVPGGYDWVDVRDIAKATITALEKGKSGERYILSGHYLSLKELSKLIGKIGNRKTPNLLAPLFLAKIGLPFIQLYSKITNQHPLYTSESLEILKNSNPYISNEKAQRELEFMPRSLEITLKDTFEWYLQNGKLD